MKPMTPLRQRMNQDMQIRNLSPRTIECYTYHVGCFAKHFGRSPELLGMEEVRAYQVYLAEKKGSGVFCRNGPKGASHKREPTPFYLPLASRSDAAPRRRPFPRGWKLDLQATLRGRIIFLRRTNDRGAVLLLGHTIEVDCRWVRRLVRVEVDLDAEHAHCYALRRREPERRPLLCSVPFAVSRKRFQE